MEVQRGVEFLGTIKLWTESVAARREVVLEGGAAAAKATTTTRCVWHAVNVEVIDMPLVSSSCRLLCSGFDMHLNSSTNAASAHA